jgi:nucleoside-diphosphate-sugar epimerase
MIERVLVTGGDGFVGRALADRLLKDGYVVRVGSRRNLVSDVKRFEYVRSPDFGSSAGYQEMLADTSVVVHCAGRAHLLADTALNPLEEFRSVNVNGTIRLARQAADQGVRRFVFLSSVGVNGLYTHSGQKFSESDPPNPHNAYAQSKLEAEQSLATLSVQTGMEVVVIRPPLVYGFNAPGNFGALSKLVFKGWPLPLGAISNNLRSLVALDNLVDFIVVCIQSPRAANETFLVSDGDDLSTTELVRGIADAAGISLKLWPIPPWLLLVIGGILGKGEEVRRLCGSLQLDTSKAHLLLNWSPPLSVREGLIRAMTGLSPKN